MNVLDICAGIGSFSLAAKTVGMDTVCQIEIDPYRQRVLQKHFPDAQKLTDIYQVKADDLNQPIDLICGGTPCQNLSIAGNGAGLAGAQSRLWFEYLRLVAALRPQWVVWENVPNALSSNDGRDFRTILMGLDECGYRLVWRVLDAQYFGVPQRRRRIFLVGHLGDGRAAQVLFERESLLGTSHSRPPAWEGIARVSGTLSKRPGGLSWDGDGNETNMLITQPYRAAKAQSAGDSPQKPIKAALSFRQRGFGDYVEDDIASALKRRDGKSATDLVIDLQQVTSKTNRSQPRPIAPTMTKNSDIVVFSPSKFNRRGIGIKPQHTNTMATLTQQLARQSDTAPHIAYNRIVRRLTPTECARLQGFPDDYLEGLDLSDTKKYQMWGDTIALPCSMWVMGRIAEIEGIE